MAMTFDPKTEQEIQEENLAPAGEYDFDVLEATDTISKKGNQMITIKIGLYVDGKIRNTVFDYLLPSMASKLRHFCDTVGLLSQYEAGTLEAADCLGRSGKVKVVIEPASESYQAKNVVKDYICRAAKPLAAGSPQVNKDDIPF